MKARYHFILNRIMSGIDLGDGPVYLYQLAAFRFRNDPEECAVGAVQLAANLDQLWTIIKSDLRKTTINNIRFNRACHEG